MKMAQNRNRFHYTLKNAPENPLGGARGAFTLIELLIVTAIISILAALLLPALSGAKERSKQAKCLSNLHQLGLAVHMYGSDFGYYPPCYTGSSDWSYILKPFLQKTGTVYSDPNERSAVIVCPSRTLPLSNLETTYSAHRKVMVDTTSGDTLRPMDNLFRPTEVVLLGDAIQDPTFGGGKCFAAFDFGQAAGWTTTGNPANATNAVSSADADITGVGENVRFRHNGIANFLFADGHCAGIKKGEFQQRHVMVNY